jgi:hypothetical protein
LAILRFTIVTGALRRGLSQPGLILTFCSERMAPASSLNTGPPGCRVVCCYFLLLFIIVYYFLLIILNSRRQYKPTTGKLFVIHIGPWFLCAIFVPVFKKNAKKYQKKYSIQN